MKVSAGFWIGMGAGLLAGAAIGMTTSEKTPMRTGVGRALHKLGIAVDRAVDGIVSDLR